MGAGSKILDTHLGSGSSRIAAYKGGFNFIGFEIDQEYYRNKKNVLMTLKVNYGCFSGVGGIAGNVLQLCAEWGLYPQNFKRITKL